MGILESNHGPLLLFFGTCTPACTPPFSLDGKSAWVLASTASIRFRPRPPSYQIPTLIGWDFFCLERQCWRGFAVSSRERWVGSQPHFRPLPPLCSQYFSVGLASVRESKARFYAGFGLKGCGWSLHGWGDREPSGKKTARRRFQAPDATRRALTPKRLAMAA